MVFMGIICSREQVNDFYPFGGTSQQWGLIPVISGGKGTNY